jgi:uncharacterized protein
MPTAMYHGGNRELQARFGSVALAGRLLGRTHRTAFTEAGNALIESLPFFFLATAKGETPSVYVPQAGVSALEEHS